MQKDDCTNYYSCNLIKEVVADYKCFSPELLIEVLPLGTMLIPLFLLVFCILLMHPAKEFEQIYIPLHIYINVYSFV